MFIHNFVAPWTKASQTRPFSENLSGNGSKTIKEHHNRYRSEIVNPEVLLVAGKRESWGDATAESEWAAIWRESGGQGDHPKPGDHDMNCAKARQYLAS